MPFLPHIWTCVVAYKICRESQNMYNGQVKPPTDGYMILLCDDGKCVTKIHSKGGNTCHPVPYFGKLLDSLKTCNFYLIFCPGL